MKDSKLIFNPTHAVIVAILLWLLSLVLTPTPLMLIIFLVIIAVTSTKSINHPKKAKKKGITPLMHFKNGTIEFDWDTKDWIFFIVLILIIVALVQGISPVKLLELFKPFAGTSDILPTISPTAVPK